MEAFDPTATPRKAFIRGFWKGMAAPLMLYSAFELPKQVQRIEFQPLPQRDFGPRSEWVRVGEYLRKAMAAEKASLESKRVPATHV